tara:strand:- start:753 stop:860 length:108 start_codon:yes stop_codon:yes gene_type:complete
MIVSAVASISDEKLLSCPSYPNQKSPADKTILPKE